MTPRITRLAPSPTGALHLGNARTFLINWLMARQQGWQILLRIEDIDGPRIKSDADRQALDDLRWLGIDADIGPFYQSSRRALYAAAIDQLIARGFAYACVCTRKEIELAASAPHAEDGAAVYPGTCRGRFTSIAEATRAVGRPPAIRFRIDESRTISWHDTFAGPQAIALSSLGDFVIAKADETPAYQLAVVVDDADAGVTDVVRGDDLLDSTPRQLLLYEALQLAPPPTYCHLPLVVGQDGRRLAKRHGDTRLSSYREGGVSASRVLKLLANWCGIACNCEPHSARELVDRFDLARVPPDRIVMSNRDDERLRA